MSVRQAAVKTKILSFVFLGGFFLFLLGGTRTVYVQADGEDVTPSVTATIETPALTVTPTVETNTVTLTPSITPTLTETPAPILSTPTSTLDLSVLRGDYVEDEVLVRFAPVAGGAQAASEACFVNDQV